MDLKSLSDYDVLDLSERDKDLADNIAFWSDRALCKGYIQKIEEFGAVENWPVNNYGEKTAQERYLQLLSKVDCVKGSEKYIEDWKEICPYRSSKKGDIKTIEYFLRKGGDVNYALIGAAGSGRLDLVKYLIDEKGATDANNALVRATYSGHIDIVKYLIEEKKAINFQLYNILTTSAHSGHIDIVKYSIEKGATNFDGALLSAASGGRLDIVKYLIEEKNQC